MEKEKGEITCPQPYGEPCLCQDKFGFIRDECREVVAKPTHMSRNGKGTKTTILIKLDKLREHASTFKTIHGDIEAKRGITNKSMVCLDLADLAGDTKDGNGNVSLEYINKAFVKIACDLLTKSEIEHTCI